MHSAEEDDEAASSSQEANIIQCQLFGDGNFRLPHLRNAGQSTKHEPPVASRILGDSFVQDFCNLPAANLAAADQNECNDFNADKQLGRTKDLFDITGKFLLCLQRAACLEKLAGSVKLINTVTILLMCRSVWGLLSAWNADLCTEYDYWRAMVVCHLHPLLLALKWTSPRRVVVSA